jgi:hypothetical protein
MELNDLQTEPGRTWRHVATIYAAPILALLLFSLWRTPFAPSETIGVLENIQIYPWLGLLAGDDKFLRPLYWLAVGVIWKSAHSIGAALVAYKVLHVATIALVMHLFLRITRVRTASEWVGLAVALPALIGTSAFRQNLENLPLNQMMFATAAALGAYLLLEERWRPSHDWAAAALSAVAVFSKEPGILVPLMLAIGTLAGAPGVRRRTAIGLALAALGYVMMRALNLPSGFQERLGWGFQVLSPPAADALFGGTLWPAYAYNIAAGVGNVWFGEPTGGVFAWTKHLVLGSLEPWQIVQAVAYGSATLLIGFWSVDSVRRGSPSDRRLSLLLLSSVVITAGISFNYARDRNMGIAAAFYAVALFRAVAWWVDRMKVTTGLRLAAGAVCLGGLVAAWQLRAAGTLYFAHDAAWENRKEWLCDFDERTRQFGDRPVYLSTLTALRRQGEDPTVPGTPPPRWIRSLIDYKW